MATRARAGGIGIHEFLIEAEHELSCLNQQSPKELIASTMAVEGKRLDEFLWSAVFASDKILNTGVVPSLIPESWYFEPPLAGPQTKLRPGDDYFKQVFNRRGSKELREHPGFRWDLVLPQHGHSMGPRLRRRGETVSGMADCRSSKELQWGRAHVGAESRTVHRTGLLSFGCFNGAAPTWARRGRSILRKGWCR